MTDAPTAISRSADLVAALPEHRTVLVTGATGLIGRRLFEALAGRWRARSVSLRSDLAILAARHRLCDDRLLR
jgi:NAD(P)-dependent dehydrogenase (short-subunit alcohol dehydrogenase family)